MSSLKEKSLKGLFWDFSGRIGLQGVGFVVSIVLARLLAPEEFGLLAIITVFINLASVFLDFGFSTALIQKQDVREEHYSAVFYLNVTMGFLLAAIVFLLAPLIGRFYDKEILVNVTRLMALGILISSFGQVMRARLRRDMNFRPISLSSIYASIISGVIAMLMAWKGFGVWSLAIHSVLNALFTNTFLYILSKIRLNFKFSKNGLKDLWPLGSKVFYSGLLDTLFYNFDSLLVGKILTPAILGYYHRAKSLEFFGLRYTASVFASILLPSLSSIQSDSERLRDTVNKAFHVLLFVSLFGCGLLFVGAKELIITVFSQKWEPSVIMFQIIIIGAFGSQVSSLFINTILSTGKARTYLLINVINKVLHLLNFGVLYVFGLKTYLFGYTIIQIINFYIQMTYINSQFQFDFKLFRQSAIYLINYSFSIAITMSLIEVVATNEPIITLLFKLAVFATVFLLIAKLLKSPGLHLVSKEIRPICRKVNKLYADRKIR